MKLLPILYTLLFASATSLAQTNLSDTALMAKGASLPFFNIIGVDSSIVSTAQIANEKNVVLVLFNPSCGHCQTVGKQIYDSISLFSNTHFIFVAGLPTLYTFKEFTDFTKIKSAANIFIGADYSNITPKIFAYNGIPQIMIYDTDKKLKTIFYKEITTRALYNAINNIASISTPKKKKKGLLRFKIKK
jgi:thiol-disulfide isomerase/thioredoxin